MAELNPRYNGRVGVYRTNEIERFGYFIPPSTPNYWFKFDAPQSTSDAVEFNTVVGSKFSRVFNFAKTTISNFDLRQTQLTPFTFGTWSGSPTFYTGDGLYGGRVTAAPNPSYSNWTQILVCRITSLPNVDFGYDILNLNNNGGGQHIGIGVWRQSSTQSYIVAGILSELTITSPGSTFSLNTKYIVTTTNTGMRLNKTAVTGTVSSVIGTSLNNFKVDAQAEPGLDIMEIIVYDGTTLSTIDIQTWENYLSSKWSI